MWQQIIINRKLTKSEIKKGLSNVFKIRLDEIQIISDFTDLTLKISKETRILCETAIADKSYPMLLSIALHDDSLVPQNDIPVIGEFCETLNCEAYISDDSLSFYSMLLVKSRTEYYQVNVDAEDFEHFIKCQIE